MKINNLWLAVTEIRSRVARPDRALCWYMTEAAVNATKNEGIVILNPKTKALEVIGIKVICVPNGAKGEILGFDMLLDTAGGFAYGYNLGDEIKKVDVPSHWSLK